MKVDERKFRSSRLVHNQNMLLMLKEYKGLPIY